VRWLALGLGIIFSLAIWLVGFALVDLVGTWFLGEPGTVSDLGYGAIGGIVVPAGFLFAWQDARALRQVFAAAFAYALAGLVSTDHRYVGLGALVAVAGLVLAALLPDRSRIVRFRPTATLVLLAAALAVPLVVYGVHMARNYADGTPPYDSHIGLDQWTGLAAMAFGLPLSVLCGRLGALSAALAAAIFGVGSIVYPDKPGSAGLTWGLAVLVWAATVIVVVGRGEQPRVAPAI